MINYDFKPQFAEAVANGIKTSTIRKRRDEPTKSGDTLALWIHQHSNNRFEYARILRTARCTSVTPISISANGIILGDRKLTAKEELIIAQRDGFVSVGAMLDFFGSVYGLPTPDLEMILWELDAPLHPCHQCGTFTTIVCEASGCGRVVCFACCLDIRIHTDDDLIQLQTCEACMQVRAEEFGDRVEVVG